MMSSAGLKILIVAGTRPEVIKVAPVVRKATELYSTTLKVELCLTGQHSSMADEALSIFGLRADHQLHIMTSDQTLNDVSRLILERLPNVFQRGHPDVVLVQGDTTSASMAAVCAFNMKIPVGHIEAGLRSHDLEAPFPEEMNRRVISCVARYNFCPTESARENLVRESIPTESIIVTGNTIVDSLSLISAEKNIDDLSWLPAQIHRPFVLITAHRRESFGGGIEDICKAIRICAKRFTDIQFIYPVHPNPNIHGPVHEKLSNVKNIVLIPPVSYLQLLALLKQCTFVVSDSGGIQEEAPSFGKYCIVLREVTERMESVDAGISELVGTDVDKIVHAFEKQVLSISKMLYPSNPYGDGRASERILQALLSKVS